MDDIIIFHKNVEQRLEEYSNMLMKFSLYSCSNFRQYWAKFMEPLIKRNGWMALWKISQKVCEDLKITYPTVVMVKVLNIEFIHLHALIEVVAVQMDISLPTDLVAPLIELWPTKAQNKEINIHLTASILDAYRFFYTKIFMPWDTDNGILTKWSTKIENRLIFFYDIKADKIPVKLVKKIYQFITDGKILNEEKEHLQMLMNDEIEVDRYQKRLVDIYVEMAKIKTEFKLIEMPLYKRGILKEMTEKNAQLTIDCVYIVQNDITIQNYISHITSHLYANANIYLCVDINQSLEKCRTNETILLSLSHHCINKSLSEFITDINIRGTDVNNTILSGEYEKAIIDTYAKVNIENVHLKADLNQLLLTIRHTNVKVTNCILESSKNDGIILLSNSTIELINCKFQNCSVAIIGNNNCNIVMKCCEINGAECGIKILENCCLKVEDCLFNDCVYGIGIGVDSELNEYEMSGGLDLLKKMPTMNVTNLRFQNTLKSDVILEGKSNLKEFLY